MGITLFCVAGASLRTLPAASRLSYLDYNYQV
jgi:hypothetical protein